MIVTVTKKEFNSVLIQTDSNESLAYTFLRFQEHYESPKFKDQIFTIGQLKRWYSETYGADTYTKDWVGFNFPSYVLKPFREGLFDPLTKEEQDLLDLFKYRNDNFYIIGANNNTTIRHELAHALYQYSLNYQQEINQICNNKTYKKHIKKIRQYILNKGYHIDVINDEIQAYVTDNDDAFIKQNLPQSIIDKINCCYQKYSKNP